MLRNSPRVTATSNLDDPDGEYDVGLKIFQAGQLLVDEPCYGSICHGGILELKEAIIPQTNGLDEECLVCAEIRSGGAAAGFFPQEHQISYRSKSGSTSYLLYDQAPIPAPARRPSPIIVLAPKTWVSRTMNSYLAFYNRWEVDGVTKQSEPLTIAALDEHGQTIAVDEYVLPYNGVFFYDVKRAVSKTLSLEDSATFVNVVARGGSSQYAIFTFVLNETSGSVAIEHSLPPFYYLNGHMGRVRDEALQGIPGWRSD